jgi:type I restriction enzyme S subunit
MREKTKGAGMSEWRETRICELAQINPETLSTKVSRPFINYLDTGNITKNKIENLQHLIIGVDNIPSRAKRIVRDKDIIYSTVRPNQEHYGYIINSAQNLIVSTGFAVLRCFDEKCDSKYLYYFLTLPDNTEFLSNVAEDSTTAYPSIKPEVIATLQLLLPPPQTQRAIAEILSSLDDKIDLLTRQNATLEALAQTYFRQWFAKDDWSETELKSYGDIVCGKTPSTAIGDYFGGNVPFIKIPDMHGNTFIVNTKETLTENGQQSQSKKTVPSGSICVSCIATVGLVSITTRASQTNQQINTIVPKRNEYKYFLYLLMKNSSDELLAMASGGSVTNNLNTGDFSKMSVIGPAEGKIDDFDSIVKPLFDKILANNVQILTLQKLRDTLLPKLVSGEVRVEV